MPASPTPALDAHRAHAVPVSRSLRDWVPADGALPALYLGHGAPTLLDDGAWMRQLLDLVADLPRPRGVVIVSAHWEAVGPVLSSAEAGTPLVYDFGGFAQHWFRHQYATPDATALADRVARLLPDDEHVHRHTSRGLDHGAWVPLTAMYPEADVPVVQLSLPTHDPARLLALGERLRPLREEGYLVVGSGFLTHGLPYLSREHWRDPQAPPPGWSLDFDAWAADLLGVGDIEGLAAYADRAPGMPYAHPTVEHLSPLFVTLGAAADPEQPVDTRIEGFWMGLAKRAFAVA